jgi:hypothetical protein
MHAGARVITSMLNDTLASAPVGVGFQVFDINDNLRPSRARDVSEHRSIPEVVGQAVLEPMCGRPGSWSVGPACWRGKEQCGI